MGATAALFRATSEEYRRHPVEREATKAFSPASIGKSYLEAIGVRMSRSRSADCTLGASARHEWGTGVANCPTDPDRWRYSCTLIMNGSDYGAVRKSEYAA